MTSLDFLGTVVIAAVTVANVSLVVAALAVPQRRKIQVAAFSGLWVGFVTASAAAGWMAQAQPFPVIGLYVATPLVVVGVLAALSPVARAALLSLPVGLLIGLNVSRVFGGLFLLLAMQGRLSGPFPASAGWGDVLTGVLALPLLWLLARMPQTARPWAMSWNVFGAADLVIAILLGVTSAAGSPLQLFHGGAGSEAMQTLPWSLVPTVLVPFYLIMHAVLFVQLRGAGSARPAQLRPTMKREQLST